MQICSEEFSLLHCVRTKQILLKHKGRRANIVIDEEVDDYETDKEKANICLSKLVNYEKNI